MRDIVRAIGIPKRQLIYLVEKGYIHPPKTGRKGKRVVLEFREEDVQIVRVMWEYMKAGLKPSSAYEVYLKYYKSPWTRLELELPGKDVIERVESLYSLYQEIREELLKSRQFQRDIETVFRYTFRDRSELTCEEIYKDIVAQRCRGPPEYQLAIQRLLSILPVEEVSHGVYRFKVRTF